MTEEEKKAIEILKGFKEGKQERDKLEINNRGGFKLGVLYLISIQNAIETLLTLIEKQEKEIEQINNRDIKRLAEIGELRTENSYLKQENEYLNCICESDEDNYINKGKIREKIEDLRRKIENNKNNWHEYFYDDMVEYSIKLLKELLEEK